MPRDVEYRSAAAKALRRLSRPDRERIVAGINGLPAGDVKVLLGSSSSGTLGATGMRSTRPMSWSPR